MLSRLFDLNNRAIQNHLCAYEEVDQASLYYVHNSDFKLCQIAQFILHL